MALAVASAGNATTSRVPMQQLPFLEPTPRRCAVCLRRRQSQVPHLRIRRHPTRLSLPRRWGSGRSAVVVRGWCWIIRLSPFVRHPCLTLLSKIPFPSPNQRPQTLTCHRSHRPQRFDLDAAPRSCDGIACGLYQRPRVGTGSLGTGWRVRMCWECWRDALDKDDL